MIGGRSGSSRCAPGTGATIGPAAPAARRHLQQPHAPSYPLYQNLVCWNAAGLPAPRTGRQSVGVPAPPGTDACSTSSQQHQQRKRPGCLCDCPTTGCSSGASCEPADHSTQPLDLSLPKIKVRQHWSGGSIVQVNDSTIISISSSEASRATSAARTLDVSVVTVPRATPSGWNSQVRLQIDIPFGSRPALPLPPVNKLHSSIKSGLKMSDDDDDLKRLTDSAHQLRLCGFYYPHLSWKDSVQLLQTTKVGTFLVRDSSDARYLYALSIQTDKGPTSVRIHYSSRGFRLDSSQNELLDHLPKFRSVLHLVDHYVAKGPQCRDKGQFFLDNSGQVHSEVQLTRPLRKEVPSLQHLCRLARNNGPNAGHPDHVPLAIRSYLAEYPFKH